MTSTPQKGSAIDLRDVVLVVGLGLVAYGAWLAWPPAGFMAPGVVLTWIALPVRPFPIWFPHRPRREKPDAR